MYFYLEMGMCLPLSGHQCLGLRQSSQEGHLVLLLLWLPAAHHRPQTPLAVDCHCPVVRAETQLLEGFFLFQLSLHSCTPGEPLSMPFFFPQR